MKSTKSILFMMKGWLAGLLCLSLPAISWADLVNTASITYADIRGANYSGVSNTVTTIFNPKPPPPHKRDWPSTMSMDDILYIDYPPGYVIDHFEWTFVWQNFGASTSGNSAKAPAQATSASVATAIPQFSPASQNLEPGLYLISVSAVDSLGNTSDATQGTITLISAESALSNARVRPNPFRASRGDQNMLFEQMPAGSTVKIFTVSGHWVKTLSAPTGSVPWDMTNDSGDKVASGIYLYLITDNQGNKSRGTLTVIR